MPLSFERLGNIVLARWEPEPEEVFPSGPALWDLLEASGYENYYFLEDNWEFFCASIRKAPHLPQTQAIAEARDFQLELELSKDRMQAWISLTPAYGGKNPELQDLIALLRAQKIIYGVKPEALDALLQSSHPLRLLVAEGDAPVDGQDARFEALVQEPDFPGIPMLREDQRADFHNLQLMTTVAAGTPLMRRHPPQTGQPGLNILKRPVPQRKGLDLPFGPCRGAEIAAEDANLLVASLAGKVKVYSNTVQVEPVFHVAEIGTATGDIRFPGTVVVGGNICQGFVLEADGDILVDGTVEAAWVQARGNLLAHQGIVGNQHSRIIAGGSLESRFVEHAQILTLGDIRIADMVIHSHLRARHRINVGTLAGKGQIAGGSVIAGERIQARIAGSSSHTRTLLEVGIDPILHNQCQRLQHRLSFYRNKLDKVGEALVQNRVKRTGSDLIPALENLREQLLLKVYELSEALQRAESPKKTGKIIITDHIYAGVTVRIGGYTRTFDQDFSGATLYVDSQKQEIALGSVRL